MKKLGKLKLNQLRDSNLSKDEMDVLIGGSGSCTCSCAYSGYGGSTTNDSNDANYQSGYQSTTYTCTCACAYSGAGDSNSSDNHSTNYNL